MPSAPGARWPRAGGSRSAPIFQASPLLGFNPNPSVQREPRALRDAFPWLLRSRRARTPGRRAFPDFRGLNWTHPFLRLPAWTEHTRVAGGALCGATVAAGNETRRTRCSPFRANPDANYVHCVTRSVTRCPKGRIRSSPTTAGHSRYPINLKRLFPDVAHRRHRVWASPGPR
jgi:hypothetical protein